MGRIEDAAIQTLQLVERSEVVAYTAHILPHPCRVSTPEDQITDKGGLCTGPVKDEVRLRVHVTHDGHPRIEGISWEGQGCSISQASLSVLADLVEGVDVKTADDLAEAFRALMHNRGQALDAEREELLGDATAFVGVAKFPARVKCAMLGWMALRDALVRALTTTEDPIKEN